jgi:hypothetical protein
VPKSVTDGDMQAVDKKDNFYRHRSDGDIQAFDKRDNFYRHRTCPNYKKKEEN